MIAEVYMPPYATDRAKLYQVLWLEGLAAYMSKALNPGATDKEVLLSDTVAADVKAVWPQIGSDIAQHLDSSGKSDIDAYLFDDGRVGRSPKGQDTMWECWSPRGWLRVTPLLNCAGFPDLP